MDFIVKPSRQTRHHNTVRGRNICLTLEVFGQSQRTGQSEQGSLLRTMNFVKKKKKNQTKFVLLWPTSAPSIKLSCINA